MLLGELLSGAIMCVSAAAQITGTTVSVIFSPAGVYYYPGEAVTVNYSVTVTLKNAANFTATGDWECYVNGTVWQGFPVPIKETLNQLSYFTASGSFTVTESNVGPYSVSCQVSGQLSGIGTFSGSSTQSFTVTGCTGNSDYSEQDTASGGYETTTFTLSAIMNPPYGSQTATEYGYGITGNLAGTAYALDCDGAANDDLPEQYAVIADNGQQQLSDGSILFNFTITNYQYSATDCDSCDTNPGGFYPVTSSSYKTQVQFQAYCGTTK